MAEKTRCEACDRTFKNHEALDMHNQSKHNVKKEEPKKTSNKKTRNWIIGIVVLGVLIAIIFFTFSTSSSDGKYDTFAQCLTDNDVKMYGAYWCPHCQDQKAMFGESWDNVNYIECSLPNRGGQNGKCNAAGINSYPTWEFADGNRLTGAQPLIRLSQLSGCPLVEDAE